MRTLDQELNGPVGNIETLVPPSRTYFERLIGACEATNITAYAEEVAPAVVAGLLAWDEARGAQMALLLGSHASILPESGLADLSEETLTSLAAWVLRSGDLLSKVGAIEMGLAALPRVPALAGPVQQLVQQILELETDDESGPLQLMMATFILVDAELSRLRILEDWPPFRRRIAALAQAGLLQRLMLGRIDVAHFATWALQRGAMRRSSTGLSRPPHCSRKACSQ